GSSSIYGFLPKKSAVGRPPRSKSRHSPNDAPSRSLSARYARAKPGGRGSVGGLQGVKPMDSCRQAKAGQQTIPQLRLELLLMPPSPVLEEIELAFLVLLLPQHVTPLEPLQALRVDLRA